MNDRVRIDIDNGVADVRLSRPEQMNALDQAMFEGLVAAGERLAADPGVRAVVLSGEGRAFCAGLDTSRFRRTAEGQDSSPNGQSHLDRLGARSHGLCNLPQHAALVWQKVPVPVIAAIHGVAFGGGLQIALGADLRYVSADAKLSVMEMKWGLVPDMGGMVILKRLLRDDVMRELVWSARIVEGTEAAALGLATRVCDDPRAAALSFAREIAQRSPHAVQAAKRLFTIAQDSDMATILQAESNEQAALLDSPNQAEAVRANLEKRAPRFIDPTR